MGTGYLSINETMFMSAYQSLGTSMGSFTPDAGPLPDISSQAITLELFREQLLELGTVMQTYRQLLEKDRMCFNKAYQNLNETDSTLARSR